MEVKALVDRKPYIKVREGKQFFTEFLWDNTAIPISIDFRA